MKQYMVSISNYDPETKELTRDWNGHIHIIYIGTDSARAMVELEDAIMECEDIVPKEHRENSAIVFDILDLPDGVDINDRDELVDVLVNIFEENASVSFVHYINK